MLPARPPSAYNSVALFHSAAEILGINFPAFSRALTAHRGIEAHRCASSARPRVDTAQFDAMPEKQYHPSSSKRRLRTYVWGNARTGALGIAAFPRPELAGKAPTFKKHTPTRLPFCELTGVKFRQLSCGYGFTLFVTDGPDAQNHQLFGTGVNTDSQLGFQKSDLKGGKPVEYVIRPTPIDLPLRRRSARVLKAAAGRAHSIFLTEEGCFSAGNNAYGQCGRDVIAGENYFNRTTIHRIQDLPEDITHIECGQDTSYFLTSKGEVYACGWGADGQTGQGDYNITATPKLIRGDIAGVKIIQISCAADCVLALSDKGQVFGWGNSEYKQLAVVSDLPQTSVPVHLSFADIGKVVSVSAGGTVCGLVNDQGLAFTWGFGLLGRGPENREAVFPTILPPTLFQAVEFNESNPIKSIHCGLMHNAVLTYRGDLYMWGANDLGQIGISSNEGMQYFPVKLSIAAEVQQICLGVDHTAVIAQAFV
ncbi:Williams-Beuren syndrome chromosomal region 16 protein-like protein [Hypsibius exemplaris]|uniref:Williams-Beuren syndrome chromosomal region 16 protein-like protein n=1 Tax=Hypsibius exemplaris TaxID=2072580 RepID=A0A9X6NEC4_HYPEX|nr:Williams-Beuren syndrome chromosomal region 16 protein-like protein [Hypsibius exemplaris]